MSKTSVLGVDFGDLDLYAVQADGDRFVQVREVEKERIPVIYFDSLANVSSLGVGFPSVNRGLGNGVDFNLHGRRTTSDELVLERLQRLRKASGHKDGVPSKVVLAVPTAMGQARRQTLLNCAQRAGLGTATLLDRCTAAALGHRGRSAEGAAPTTLLVYHCDYSDCEYALVRLTRGRCRVVGAGVVAGLSGERLDAMVIENLVLGLRAQGVILGLRQYTAVQWLTLRAKAELARLAMSRRDAATVELPGELTGGDGVRLRLDGTGFRNTAEPVVEASLDSVQGMLERNGLSWDAIDTVLVTGEVAVNPPVMEVMAKRVGKVPVKGGTDVIAVGAAIHGEELGTDGTDPVTLTEAAVIREGVSGARVDAPERTDTPFVAVIESVSTTAGGASPLPASPLQAEGLEKIRRLIAEGRDAEALAQIEAQERALDALKDRLARQALSSPRTLIENADALLATSRYQDAVALSHEAYRLAPTNAEIFADMIRVHVEAGLALTRPEEFNEALDILHCAHRHDQTDRSVHRALAERLYLQADAWARQGDPERAQELVKEALTFAPANAQAQALLKRLQ